ncbi:hypothetical protein ABLV98_00900 [Staphylococcus sp. 50Mo3-1]|uniref:hypothetical protein n=1 Tax=Staphylococcus sp. 50Mo3-2 TaxID=3135642 RepID=UPI0033D5F3AC
MGVIFTSLISSSVVAAIITYLSNTKIKNKELLVQIKLEEQNKWISKVDESLKKFVCLNLEYSKGLIDYSLNKIGNDEISTQIMELNKSQHSLFFYINQLEYSEKSAEETMSIIQDIVKTIDTQTSVAQCFRAKQEITNKEMNEMKDTTVEIEKIIGERNISLAIKLGKLAKEEKRALANEVVESTLIKILLRIRKNPPK